MKDELVNFKIAKLAEDKGFDVFCENIYDIQEQSSKYPFGTILEDCYYKRPTQSLLQRWLREKYNIQIEIYYGLNGYLVKAYKTVEEAINLELKIIAGEVKKYETYEEALEDGLMEALTKIEL